MRSAVRAVAPTFTISSRSLHSSRAAWASLIGLPNHSSITADMARTSRSGRKTTHHSGRSFCRAMRFGKRDRFHPHEHPENCISKQPDAIHDDRGFCADQHFQAHGAGDHHAARRDFHNFGRAAHEQLDRQRAAAGLEQFAAALEMAFLVTGDEELHVRIFRRHPFHDADLQRKIDLDFVVPRAGKNAHDWPFGREPLAAERLVELVVGRFVEKGMADVLGG